MPRGGKRPNAGRPLGSKESRPRRPTRKTDKPLVIDIPQCPPELAPAAIAEAKARSELPVDVNVPMTLQQRLLRYSDLVESAVLGMITDNTLPAEARIKAIELYYDRAHGSVVKVSVSHSSGEPPVTSVPIQFGFKRSLPAPSADAPIDVVPKSVT